MRLLIIILFFSNAAFGQYISQSRVINLIPALASKLAISDSASIYHTKFRADTSRVNFYTAIFGKQAIGNYAIADSSVWQPKYRADTARVNLYTSIGLKADIASPTFTGTVAGITKSMVGLSNVDNTSDASKPVSTATQTTIDLKANIASPTFTGTVGGITASMVGLGNVNNTSDAAKPVSTAGQTALDLKANIASPTFTGTVSGITKSMVGLGSVDNTSDAGKPVSTAQQTALDLKANLASPTFTGTPTIPTGTIATTQTAGNSTTAVATTAFVTTADNLKANLVSPSFTTPSLGAATATSINGNILTTGSSTYTGTAGQTYTFPTTSATIARTDAANTFTGIQTMTSPAITTPAITGISTGSGVATAATANTLVLRDGNANTSVNNTLMGYTTTATAAGTTTLTVASTRYQYFTGATTQTVVMPVTSTLVLGTTFEITNKSTGALNVQSSGANNIIFVAAGQTAILVCQLTSGTTAASWSYTYTGLGSRVVVVNNTQLNNTGSTTESAAKLTATIPAYSIGVNGSFHITMLTNKTNSANIGTYRVKFNGTTVITVAHPVSTVFGNSYVIIANRNSLSAQVTGSATTNSNTTFNTYSTSAIAVSAFNTAADITVTITIQNALAADQVNVERFEIIANY